MCVMACVSMCVFPGPCTATGFRVSQQGLIDTDDGFPQWKWVMCFLFSGHTYHRHTHAQRVCAYVKCNEWAWQNRVRSHLRSFYGCHALARVPFLENAQLHLHTLKLASCSFVSCELHLQQDYQDQPLFWFFQALSCFRLYTDISCRAAQWLRGS